MCMGLIYLERVDNKVLSQHWQCNGLSDLHEVYKASLKKFFIGENRNSLRSLSLVIHSYSYRIKIMTDDTLGWRRFFYFCNN